MSLRSYIFLMLLATIACYFAWGSIIYFFDPLQNGTGVLFLFYISLFLALVGTFSVVGLIFRIIFTKDNLVFKKVVISFRQSIWFAGIIIVSLYLKSADLLLLRNILILIFAFVLLEVFFIIYKNKPSLKI